MDVNQIPKMRSEEVNTDGRPLNQPGVYREKETGAEFITVEGREGVAQADALMSDNMKIAHGYFWERVGDVPSRIEILARNKAQAVKDATEEALQKGKDEAELKEAKKVALEEAKKALEKEPVAV